MKTVKLTDSELKLIKDCLRHSIKAFPMGAPQSYVDCVTQLIGKLK